MSQVHEQTDGANHPGHGVSRPMRLWSCCLVAGMLAGLLSWSVGEMFLMAFKPPRYSYKSKGIVLRVTDRPGEAKAGALNAGLAFVILGASLGGIFGAAGGISRGSFGSAGKAAFRGSLLSVLAAIAASAIALPASVAYTLRNPDPASINLMVPLLLL